MYNKDWVEKYSDTWCSRWFDVYEEDCGDLMLGGKGILIPYNRCNSILEKNIKERVPDEWWINGIFRLDTVSPKDIHLSLRFYSDTECINALSNSERCQSTLRGIFNCIPDRYVYIRPYVDEVFDEVRCSIYHSK